MNVTIRVVLDEQNFRRLVAGEIVALRTRHQQTIEITLADIGFRRMAHAIAEAIEGRRPLDPPEAREFLPRRRSK